MSIKCKVQKLISQVMRFGVVGGIAFAIDYSVLFILTDIVGIYYLVSSCVAFSVSVIFNYIASILWVFDVDKNKDSKKMFCVFLFLSIIGLGINQIIMWIGVEYISLYYMLVKIGATAIDMVYNFITRKIFME